MTPELTTEYESSKHNPVNKRDAYCYQLQDDLKKLQAFAVLEQDATYQLQAEIMINRLKQSIES